MIQQQPRSLPRYAGKLALELCQVALNSQRRYRVIQTPCLIVLAPPTPPRAEPPLWRQTPRNRRPSRRPQLTRSRAPSRSIAHRAAIRPVPNRPLKDGEAGTSLPNRPTRSSHLAQSSRPITPAPRRPPAPAPAAPARTTPKAPLLHPVLPFELDRGGRETPGRGVYRQGVTRSS